MSYPFSDIEKKWQKYWKDYKTFKVTEDENYPPEKRAYVLDMFPYPSGAGLHVGHPEGYTATDIYCRYLRMNGYAVLHPMGFDSFGLPAENYAIKTGTHPRITTKENIDTFRRQIQAFGFSYDWDRELATSDVDYYRWTQWIFLQLYKKGLAYETEAPINWCPSCLTGLANEEVKEGCCERCGTQVVRKNVRQWMLKITAYAERLLEDLEELDWPQSVKMMQRNWIGKSTGAEIDFHLAAPYENEKITVYTTRPDTIFGATYLVLAPEHPLVMRIVSGEEKDAVQQYIDETAKKTDLERTELAKKKTGVFTGAYAVNPLTKEPIPIWISDYILVSYGTGAIMAVPAHDERDWEFAQVFSLPVIQTVASEAEWKEKGAAGDYRAVPQACTAADGYAVNSGEFTGLPTREAIERVTDYAAANGFGKKAVNYKLRDWVFSRQRYWGEPIPLVHCPKCGVVPLDEKDLPLALPETDSYTPSDTGESPLAKIPEWVNTVCPHCGAPSRHETNTMPQWAGSCWYYLRYLDPHNAHSFCAKEKEAYWMPVNLYVGGAEHAVLHLLYARFWHKVLYDLGVVHTKEPFMRLVNQGMITSFAYQRSNGSLVPVDEVVQTGDDAFEEKSTGEKLKRVIAKMSKSLKNVINPDEMIAQYGADSCRMYEMFMGPLDMSKPWNTQGLIGIFRFLEKIWAISEKELISCPVNDMSTPEHAEITKLLNKTIKKITEDTASLNFNTAISQMMIFVNTLGKYQTVPRFAWEAFVKLLAPYAPHLAEELWEKLGHTETIAYTQWPMFVEKFCIDSECTIVVQINGKVRDKFQAAVNLPKDELEALALKTEGAQRFLSDKQPKKVIVVPNKIVNIVL
ncbi:leucine--tRNA ligase [Treponema medium]|uniref:Leucine--tRNA ligase n=2 Tax=Treponema medium TaxID=58231 RepID=A0AA87NR26_TREMD|nr:leucine--tRNA ligase [Treponema medium]EPF28419.1 leucine-tRNA ligase [Treponema medium ATCC 700293]QSH97735.1 leucine--tRNA ligase [Treponema medium]